MQHGKLENYLGHIPPSGTVSTGTAYVIYLIVVQYQPVWGQLSTFKTRYISKFTKTKRHIETMPVRQYGLHQECHSAYWCSAKLLDDDYGKDLHVVQY